MNVVKSNGVIRMKHKAHFNIILLIVALFGVFFGMEQVSAKEVLLTCNYSYSYPLAGESVDAKVVIYDNGTSYSEIVNFNGKDLGFVGQPLTKKNNENDDLIKASVLNSKKCPDFALIYTEPDFNNFFTLSYDNRVILGLDKNSLEQYKQDNAWMKNTMIATSSTYVAPSETAEEYYKHVEEATASIEKEYQRIEDECNEDPDNFQKCMNRKYSNISTLIGSYEIEINSWIKQGYISESDSRVVEFRNLASEKKKLLEEVKDGYIDPGEGTIDRNYDICSIFSGTLGDIVKGLISWIKLLIPVVIIVLGIMDAISVVLSGEDKKMKDVFSRFLKRMIAGLLIIFVPSLISFLINLSGVLEPYHIDDIWCGLWG